MRDRSLYVKAVMAGMLAAPVVALAQNPSEPMTPPQRDTPPARQTPPATPPAEREPGIRDDARHGKMDTPKYAQKLTANVAENSIQLFEDSDFAGSQTSVANILSMPTGGLQAYPAEFDDSVSSIRWNLSPGTLVVLFDGTDGKGGQLALWGKGEIADLGTCDFEDEASRWAWYNLGGGSQPRSAGDMLAPHGSQPLTGTVGQNVVLLFDDERFTDEQQAIRPVTAKAAGTWHELPGDAGITGEKENAASSIRWDLPEGVVLLLSADDEGSNHIALFGKGQYEDLAACDFSNRASRWSWAYIGGDEASDKRDR